MAKPTVEQEQFAQLTQWYNDLAHQLRDFKILTKKSIAEVRRRLSTLEAQADQLEITHEAISESLLTVQSALPPQSGGGTERKRTLRDQLHTPTFPSNSDSPAQANHA